MNNTTSSRNKAIRLFIALIVLFSVMCNKQTARMAFYIDEASILTPKEIEAIQAYGHSLLNELKIEILVVTLKERAEDIDGIAAELFTKYKVGNRTKTKRGVMFLVDPISQQVRVEIGYQLEHIYTDAFISYVQTYQMNPFFAQEKVGIGIVATVELLVSKARGVAPAFYDDTSLVTLDSEGYLSGGAGGSAKMRIGGGFNNRLASPEERAEFGPQPTPLDAMEKRKEILRMQIHDWNLPIYTPETIKESQGMPSTIAQFDNELRGITNISSPPSVFIENNLAVVRYAISDQENNPYFLRNDGHGWMFDFSTMREFVRFDHMNRWWFKSIKHEYIFAFQDIKFSHGDSGYPMETDRYSCRERWLSDLKNLPSGLEFNGCNKLTNEYVAKQYKNKKKAKSRLKKWKRVVGYFDFYENLDRCKTEVKYHSLHAGVVMYKNAKGAREAYRWFKDRTKSSIDVNVSNHAFARFWNSEMDCGSKAPLRQVRIDFSNNTYNGYLTLCIEENSLTDQELNAEAVVLAEQLDIMIYDKMFSK